MYYIAFHIMILLKSSVNKYLSNKMKTRLFSIVSKKVDTSFLISSRNVISIISIHATTFPETHSESSGKS